MAKTDCLAMQITLEHRLTRIETIIGLTFLAIVSQIVINLVQTLGG